MTRKTQPLSQLKLHARAYYNRLKPMICPILDEEVHFTAEGYFHLINESHSKPGNTIPRKPTEQYMKLMQLNKVPTVLKHSTRIAEKRKNRKKVKGKWKNVIQTEVVCDINSVTVSVIVEKVGNGKTKFLSVFPKRQKRP